MAAQPASVTTEADLQTLRYSEIISLNSSASQENTFLTCDDVILARSLSLTVAFCTVFLICYLLTALVVFGRNTKPIYTSIFKGRFIVFRIYNLISIDLF